MIFKTYYHKVEPYGHCASICAKNNGVWISYYNGRECTDQQAVNFEFWIEDSIIARLKIWDKTGNSILIPSKDGVTAIYSYFNDTDGTNVPRTPIERWKYCTNWQSQLKSEENKINISNSEILKINPKIGALTRCAPIRLENEWLLPMYTEHNCHGFIIKSEDGINWEQLGDIGKTKNLNNGRFGSGICMQPTIWWDRDRLHSLSRDITTNYKAWYSQSTNKGKTWSNPEKTNIDNKNNSVVVINNENTRPMMIWNEGKNRKNLTFGIWNPDTKNAESIIHLNAHETGSYPNYCFDHRKRLHIVHSSQGPIIRHILDKEGVEDLIARRKTKGSCLEFADVPHEVIYVI